MINEDYKIIIEKSPIGYAYCKIICNEAGIPCDYEFIEVNLAFEKLTGLKAKDVIGKRITELIPEIGEGEFNWIETYGNIALNGGTEEFEQFFKPLNRWYRVYVSSQTKGYFITWFADISKEIRDSEEKTIILTSMNDEQKKIEDQLESKTAELERFFNINLDLLCIADLNGNFIKVNNAWEGILGYPAAELEKRKFLEFVHPEDMEATLDTMSRLGQNERVLYFVNRYKCKDESYRYIEWCSQPYGELIYAAARDITDRKLTEEALQISEARLNYAMNGTRAGLWDWDVKNNTVYYSPQWKSMLGYEQDEVENTFEGWKSLWHPDDKIKIEKALNDYISGETDLYEVDHRLRCKNGNWRWVLTRGEYIKNSSGEPFRWVGTNIDITNLKEAEGKILYLSFHDQLTGLYNRRFYEEELNRVDNEENLPLSLIMADVNGLKLANDAFGHLVGDELLKKAAYAIKQVCRSGEIASRIGGDEFIIILPKTNYKAAESIVNRIIKATSNEKVGLINLSISFGLATKRNLNENIEETFKKAEEHMYQRKANESPKMKEDTINTILSTLYERFPYEKDHSEKVSEICGNLGKHLDFSDDDIEAVKFAGRLHDIGKITIDEKILLKPSRLNDSEWIEVKRHSETGYRLLNSVNETAKLAKYVLYHHENWDGSGYPDGLRGEEIPIQARIIGLADAYNAMIRDRPFRKALSEQEALQEIKKNAGSQFDPIIVQKFLDCLKEGTIYGKMDFGRTY